MTKRQFIDTVRQYAEQSRRKRTDYSAMVEQLRDTWLAGTAQDGATAAEVDKNRAWAESFIAREYNPYIPANPKVKTG